MARRPTGFRMIFVTLDEVRLLGLWSMSSAVEDASTQQERLALLEAMQAAIQQIHPRIIEIATKVTNSG